MCWMGALLLSMPLCFMPVLKGGTGSLGSEHLWWRLSDQVEILAAADASVKFGPLFGAGRYCQSQI